MLAHKTTTTITSRGTWTSGGGGGGGGVRRPVVANHINIYHRRRRSGGVVKGVHASHQQWRKGGDADATNEAAAAAAAAATHVVRRLSSRIATDRRRRARGGGVATAALSTRESDDRSTSSSSSPPRTGNAELATLELLHDQIQAPQSPILSPEASTDYIGPSGLVNEFRDSAGNEFNVVLSNEDAPEVRTEGHPSPARRWFDSFFSKKFCGRASIVAFPKIVVMGIKRITHTSIRLCDRVVVVIVANFSSYFGCDSFDGIAALL